MRGRLGMPGRGGDDEEHEEENERSLGFITWWTAV